MILSFRINGNDEGSALNPRLFCRLVITWTVVITVIIHFIRSLYEALS